MKQALIYIGMLLLAISCGQNRDRLHTGDLLFQAGKNTEMTGAITAATGEEGPLNFSHVGIAVTGNGADSVLEATTDGGVRLTLLEEFHCSELVWESYRAENGTPLFTARPMNFRAADGTLPQFWADLFDQLGEQVPEGLPGTNPNDMAREELLEEVHRYF